MATQQQRPSVSPVQQQSSGNSLLDFLTNTRNYYDQQTSNNNADVERLQASSIAYDDIRFTRMASLLAGAKALHQIKTTEDFFKSLTDKPIDDDEFDHNTDTDTIINALKGADKVKSDAVVSSIINSKQRTNSAPVKDVVSNRETYHILRGEYAPYQLDQYIDAAMNKIPTSLDGGYKPYDPTWTPNNSIYNKQNTGRK